ncbi:MAG: hypothetical protein K2I67_02120 [Malacoplasma sp.]|nr:hypothetical protein [Malacoplasma sp.]
MIKIKLFVILNFSILFILVLVNSNVNVFSFVNNESEIENSILVEDKNNKELESQVSIESIFEKNSIYSYELIYNLDDSADYFYIEFEKGGYAVFAIETMEMLEYSLQGTIPYTTLNSKKYYAGPSNYLQKFNDNFVNVSTGVQLDISNYEAKKYAEKSREVLVEAKMKKFNIQQNISTDFEKLIIKNDFTNSSKLAIKETPEYDRDNLIPANDTGVFITNANYFTIPPTHGKNDSNGSYGNGNSQTCGAVAAQLLLGYNNYYNDRRIIPDRYLNGYNDETNSVSIPERNPNYCLDPMTLNEWTAGTRSEDTGDNSFYSKMVTSIMEPNTSGASNKKVKNGIDKYLKENISSSDYSLEYEEKDWFFGYRPISSSIIKAEIDAGRPLLISMDSNLGGCNHDVVGYGYQDYTYPNNKGTYSGYVVHFGWKGDGRKSVWINESWCDGYVSLKMNHIHDYIYIRKIDNNGRIEYKCSTCGHRTDSAINMSQNEPYTERITQFPQVNGKKYYDYYVTFKTEGNKLFQTFGPNDPMLCLYDSEYNELVSDDDSGEYFNALFSYNVETNKSYILRVKLYDSTKKGSVKIGINPSYEAYSRYENIWGAGNTTSMIFEFPVLSYSTRPIIFTPSEFGIYTLKTGYLGDTRVDTYLYFVDPTITDECLFNDDGAGDLQALITTELVADRTYFLVVSPYHLSSTDVDLSLTITKINDI